MSNDQFKRNPLLIQPTVSPVPTYLGKPTDKMIADTKRLEIARSLGDIATKGLKKWADNKEKEIHEANALLAARLYRESGTNKDGWANFVKENPERAADSPYAKGEFFKLVLQDASVSMYDKAMKTAVENGWYNIQDDAKFNQTVGDYLANFSDDYKDALNYVNTEEVDQFMSMGTNLKAALTDGRRKTQSAQYMQKINSTAETNIFNIVLDQDTMDAPRIIHLLNGIQELGFDKNAAFATLKSAVTNNVYDTPEEVDEIMDVFTAVWEAGDFKDIAGEGDVKKFIKEMKKTAIEEANFMEIQDVEARKRKTIKRQQGIMDIINKNPAEFNKATNGEALRYFLEKQKFQALPEDTLFLNNLAAYNNSSDTRSATSANEAKTIAMMGRIYRGELTSPNEIIAAYSGNTPANLTRSQVDFLVGELTKYSGSGKKPPEVELIDKNRTHISNMIRNSPAMVDLSTGKPSDISVENITNAVSLDLLSRIETFKAVKGRYPTDWEFKSEVIPEVVNYNIQYPRPLTLSEQYMNGTLVRNVQQNEADMQAEELLATPKNTTVSIGGRKEKGQMPSLYEMYNLLNPDEQAAFKASIDGRIGMPTSDANFGKQFKELPKSIAKDYLRNGSDIKFTPLSREDNLRILQNTIRDYKFNNVSDKTLTEYAIERMPSLGNSASDIRDFVAFTNSPEGRELEAAIMATPASNIPEPFEDFVSFIHSITQRSSSEQ